MKLESNYQMDWNVQENNIVCELLACADTCFKFYSSTMRGSLICKARFKEAFAIDLLCSMILCNIIAEGYLRAHVHTVQFKKYVSIFGQLKLVEHSLNAILLPGDTALNSSGFPWHRISFFMWLTAIYVVFQWILHAYVSIWWPYPILDLSLEDAPLWYLVVALAQIPCYAIFVLLVKIKHLVLSKWFPQSYQFCP
ncbi:uncharacterized protein LOC111402680 [Olea europaea var. sylvestris]|uniref:uncharacterized protein LOC111402680 n=1 Tax=Olea europaea var. sylvestris TaxID=158386 RepID=UPI000C1D1438|nr:uncharacterized protein LOC111402680 [Olea europaea var. sylvestris]